MDPVSALTVLVWTIDAVRKGCEIYNRIRSVSEKIDKLEQQIHNRLGYLEQLSRTLLPSLSLEWGQQRRMQRHLDTITEAVAEAAEILDLWNRSSTQQSRIQKGLFKVGLNCGRLEVLASDIKTNVDDIREEFNLSFKPTEMRHNDTATACGTQSMRTTGTLPNAGLQHTTLPTPYHSQNTQALPHNQQQHPSIPAVQPQSAVPGAAHGVGSVPGNSGKPGLMMSGSGLPSTKSAGVPNTSSGQPQPLNPLAYTFTPLNNAQPNYQPFTPPRPPVLPPSFPRPGAALPQQQSSAAQNTPSQLHQPLQAGPRTVQSNLPAYPQPPAPPGFTAPQPPPLPNGPMPFPSSRNPAGFPAAVPPPAVRMPQPFTKAPTNFKAPQPTTGQMAPTNFKAPQPTTGQIPQGTFHHSGHMPPQPQLNQYQTPQPQAQSRPYKTPVQPAPQPQAPRWNGHWPTPPTPPAINRPQDLQQKQYPNRAPLGGGFPQPQPSNQLPQHGPAGMPQHRTGPPSCPAPGMGNMANQTPHAQTSNHNLAHQATAGRIPNSQIPHANNTAVGVGQPPHPVSANRLPQPGPVGVSQHNTGPARVAGGTSNAPNAAIRPSDTSQEQRVPTAGNPKVQMRINQPGITITPIFLQDGVITLDIT